MEYLFLVLIICVLILIIINSKSFGVSKVSVKTRPLNIDIGDLSRFTSDDYKKEQKKLESKLRIESKDKSKYLLPSEISSISNEKKNRTKFREISNANINFTPKDITKTNELYYLDDSKKSQVYHVFDNAYTYKEAIDKCNKHNARLATPKELKDVYDNGGYWCSWGWASDGHAYMPNNNEKCNKSLGLLSGKNIDPFLKLGVNCYGAPY